MRGQSRFCWGGKNSGYAFKHLPLLVEKEMKYGQTAGFAASPLKVRIWSPGKH